MSSEQLDHEGSPQPDGASPAAPSAVSVTAPSHPGTQDFHIVGIGASAGGLDSLERLFTHLPTDTGMAFVVLQHLSPDFKSLMDELLSRRTQMPIRQAEHDMAVEPNTVYLLPPMKEMIIRQRRLLLNDRDPRHGLTLPIDLFFRSLAQDVGERAVAVILSGSGSDGSRGVQEISKAGGAVLLRKPRHRAVQRDAAQRDAHRHGRPGAAARGDRRWPSPRSAGPAADAPPRPGLRRRARRRRHPPPASGRVRDRLLALQGRHGHAAHRAAPGAQPLARHRHVRRAAAAAIRAS